MLKRWRRKQCKRLERRVELRSCAAVWRAWKEEAFEARAAAQWRERHRRGVHRDRVCTLIRAFDKWQQSKQRSTVHIGEESSRA